MNSISKILLSIVLGGAALLLATGDRALFAAELADQRASIGVYDSRAIAYAYFHSKACQQKLTELTEAAKEAKNAGELKRFKELETTLQQEQEKIHLQVFSTAPVDDVLAKIQEQLPAIQSAANVGQLVSQWDAPALHKFSGSNQVDVTDLLLREFELDEKKTKIVQDIRKRQPLPLGQARKLSRKGRL